MKTIVLKLLLQVTLILFISGCASPPCEDKTANECGREIYYQLDEHIFDIEETRKAVKKLEYVANIDKDAEWVALSFSLLLLNSAYEVGDLYLKSSYDDNLLAESKKKASEISDNIELSQSHAHLARLQIIEGEYRKAWFTLNEAHQLDNNNFYPWFLKGVISYFMGDYSSAEELLIKSEKISEFKYQRRLATRYRQKVARQEGDSSKEEELLLKNIRENPDYAYMYSHYAGFLERQQRYKEAIEYYEKTIAIKPYPNAIRQLERLKEEMSNSR